MNTDLRKAGLSLFELGQSLGLAPPSHGYTIAEKSPEIVTAPGVYFPIKKGRVIPLKSRQEGGTVEKVNRRTMVEKMLDESNIEEPAPTLELARGPYEKGNKGIPGGGGIAREWTGPTPRKKNIPIVSRQFGGNVDPLKEFENTGINYSLNSGAPTQQGIEATANTALIQPTPVSVAPSLISRPEENQTQTTTSPTLTGMAEYEANAAKTKGISSTGIQAQSQPTNPGFNLNNVGSLMSFMPPRFRENRSSPIFRSEQKATYDQKMKPYMDILRTMKGEIPLIPRADGGGMDPSMTEEELKRLKEAFPGTISSRSSVGSTVPLGSSRTPITTPEARPELLASHVPTIAANTQPGLDTFLQIEKPIPSPETTPKGPITPSEQQLEGTFTSTPMTEEESKKALTRFEASPRNLTNLLTEGPGYKETFPGGLTLERPAGYRSYYEAHPQEKLVDEEAERIRQENKPLIDTYMKLIEDARNRSQGFGLGLNPRQARKMQLASTAELPQLTAGLEKFRATQDKGAQITPHLVQNEKGEYVYSIPPSGVRPPGVIPANIRGKVTEKAEKTPTEMSLLIKSREVGPDGKPTPEAIEAKATLNEFEKTRGRGIFADVGTIGTTPPGVKNEAALEGIPPGDAAVIKQLVDYKIPLPSGFALRSPYWQNILGRAALYDTGFDAAQYQVRLRLRNDFVSGKAAQNIRSLNTAVNHLDTLFKKAKGLENSPVQFWNWAANSGLTAIGDPRVVEFNNAATAIEGELANVFKNTGATDQEIKSWRKNINWVQSPDQLIGGINTVIQLLGGRLGALQGQYETGMGKPKDFRFLSPRSHQILKDIGVNVDEIDPVGSATIQGQTESEKRKVIDGVSYVKRNGDWYKE